MVTGIDSHDDNSIPALIDDLRRQFSDWANQSHRTRLSANEQYLFSETVFVFVSLQLSLAPICRASGELVRYVRPAFNAFVVLSIKACFAK